MADVNPIRLDQFVHRIVEDPADPPDTLLVIGFVGASSEEDCTRIYLDVMLAAYVDLPNHAILHAQPLPESQSHIGGSYVWVRRDADLVERIREAYDVMTRTQQEFVGDLQSTTDSWPDLSADWPDLPTT